MTDQDRPVHAPDVEVVPSADHQPAREDGQYIGAHDPGDREWTHDPLERSFFGTVGRGYAIGIVVFGLFAFLLARTQAPEWGFGAAIGAAVFVAFFAGVLGGVVLIGLWAMKNEELIRGNETGDTSAPGWVVDTSHDAADGQDETVAEPAAAEAETVAEPEVADAEPPLPEEAEPERPTEPAAAEAEAALPEQTAGETPADSPSEGSAPS